MNTRIQLTNVYSIFIIERRSIKTKVTFWKSLITGVVRNELEKKKNKKFNIKKILEKINIKPLKNETINFLNLLSEYNLVPKGMCLKLHLLGGEAIRSFDKKEYDEYNIVDKKTEFKLSTEQKKILKEVL